MDKTYQPSAIEQTWYKEWEEKGYFKPYQDGLTGEGYSIMIPPPNVTGSLHMGHAFQHTIQDALTRYKRARSRYDSYNLSFVYLFKIISKTNMYRSNA